MQRFAWGLVLVVGMSWGCDSADDIKDKFPDDIDVNLTLDDIGEAGLGKICSTFEEWVRDMYSSSHWVKAVCTAEAIKTTTGAVSCANALEACLEDTPPELEALIRDIQSQAGCTAVAVEPVGCSSTVGQVEDCLDALASELDKVQLTLTCAAAGQELDPNWWKIQKPAACSTVETACP